MAARSFVEAAEGVPLDQADLLARCLAGDRSAQRSFYERYAPFVLRTARRLGMPPEEAEDVAQEVFTIAFHKLDQFSQGEISTWLYRICSRRVHHHHQARRVRQTFARLIGASPAPELPQSQDRAVFLRDAERRMSEILSRMNAKKREVFVLFEIEELSGEAIAERVGCPLDTVWSRLFHARREFARIGRSRDLLERTRSGT
jgi:RNA polymerase sigma-70 factor (ECF subfamily)